jgi:serine/threonine protein kinase
MFCCSQLERLCVILTLSFILSTQGSGGYGVVYYGNYTADDGSQLPAAVKVISNSDYDEAHSSKFKTFQDEVDMILLFRGNDCIVQVYSYCLDFPRAYIVYEYLPNDTLARFIHNNAVRHSYLQILQVRSARLNRCFV